MRCRRKSSDRPSPRIANSRMIRRVPALQFKQIHPTEPIYSVRINRDYRAVGVKSDREIIWFWIGSHSDYDKLIAQF